MSSQCSDTGIHFSIIRNVDYFYTRKFNWIPVSEHWDDKKRSTGMTHSTMSFQRMTRFFYLIPDWLVMQVPILIIFTYKPYA
ncbi:hypothetical protein OUY_01850 [Wolbachia endosymbiont of Leptopilina clavipes]|nr:hypothetical protein OUY_01850 [Wolbachia endosymbiont of Leptopilina clavipes]